MEAQALQALPLGKSVVAFLSLHCQQILALDELLQMELWELQELQHVQQERIFALVEELLQ